MAKIEFDETKTNKECGMDKHTIRIRSVDENRASPFVEISKADGTKIGAQEIKITADGYNPVLATVKGMMVEEIDLNGAILVNTEERKLLYECLWEFMDYLNFNNLSDEMKEIDSEIYERLFKIIQSRSNMMEKKIKSFLDGTQSDWCN